VIYKENKIFLQDNCLLGWLPSLDLHTALQQMLCSPSATLWGFPTYRPAGSTRCQTTKIPSMSVSTQTSLHSAVPFWIWCSSSSGKLSQLCMMTALVRKISSLQGYALNMHNVLKLIQDSCYVLVWFFTLW
uniref:Uncharacterized protein n=1 Tax=Ursus americanus TaxID=9643 RepID=A0A452RZ27_URSAM